MEIQKISSLYDLGIIQNLTQKIYNYHPISNFHFKYIQSELIYTHQIQIKAIQNILHLFMNFPILFFDYISFRDNRNRTFIENFNFNTILVALFDIAKLCITFSKKIWWHKIIRALSGFNQQHIYAKSTCMYHYRMYHNLDSSLFYYG